MFLLLQNVRQVSQKNFCYGKQRKLRVKIWLKQESIVTDTARSETDWAQSAADPGFFLGGGAPLRNGVTNTNKPHFLAEYQLYKKTVGHLRGGGGCTPPAPSP